MHRFFLLLIAGTTASATAFADDQVSLHGTYAFTGTSSCIQDSASLGFNPNLTPKGPAIFYSFAVEGTRTFHADGTGTVNGRTVSVDAPPAAQADSSDFSFQFTYTIDAQGKLSTAVVPGTFTGTMLTGPRAGQTVFNQVPEQSGFIGEGARSLVLGEPTPVVESLSFSNGDNFLRICNRSRILVRIREDDDHR